MILIVDVIIITEITCHISFVLAYIFTLFNNKIMNSYSESSNCFLYFKISGFTYFCLIAVVETSIPIVTRNCSSNFHWQCTVDSRRVWPVSRGCLLLHGTWSHLLISEVHVVHCSFCSGRFWRFSFWYLWFLYINNFEYQEWCQNVDIFWQSFIYSCLYNVFQ